MKRAEKFEAAVAQTDAFAVAVEVAVGNGGKRRPYGTVLREDERESGT